MTAANPPINSPVEPRVVVIPASTRSGSVNKALAEMIATEFHRQGEPTRVIDLAEYPMPLYDGDLEARDGVPATAVELARRLTRAEVLVVVSPEYNGTFTPLLKNTVDWLTRVDVSVLAHLFVLVASASPGRGVERGYGHAELGETVFRIGDGDTVKILDGVFHSQVSAPGYGM